MHLTSIYFSDPPGTPDYIDVTRETITLKWNPPVRDGGSKIVAYSIEKRQGSERWVRCNFTDVCECQYTVTGLSPGDRYEFRIIARNAVGTISPPSQSSGIIMTRDENGKHSQLIPNKAKNIFLKILFGPWSIKLKQKHHFIQIIQGCYVMNYNVYLSDEEKKKNVIGINSFSHVYYFTLFPCK